jgi:hypothetical protein
MVMGRNFRCSIIIYVSRLCENSKTILLSDGHAHQCLSQGRGYSLKGVKALTLEPVMTNIFCYKDTEGHGVQFAGYQKKDIKGHSS